KVFFNALERPENQEMPDLSRREITILAPMLALMIWIGFQPSPILRRMEPSVQAVLELVNGPGPQAGADQGTPAGETLTSTTPEEEGEEPDEEALALPGDRE
ncbi:hypothetical protein ACFL3S_04135, partial [Gemmatimonadota bacterium]